jgi:hypothetical protein
MNNLSNLSDEQLKSLYSQKSSPKRDLSSLSDEELKNLYQQKKYSIQSMGNGNNLSQSLSKIPGYALGAAVTLPGKLIDVAKMVPGSASKIVHNPVDSIRDFLGGAARGSQNFASSLGEVGQWIGDRAYKKIYKDFTGKDINIPKVNVREELGLGKNNPVDLGKIIESNNPDPLISSIGQYALGGASGGSRLAPMILANAAYNTTQSIPGNRIRGATEGAVNSGLPVGLVKGLNELRPSNLFNQERMGNLATNRLLKNIDSEKASPVVQASNRLGLAYITPAEASGNPLVGAIEGRVGRTPTGAKLLQERSQERLNSERLAIKKLLYIIGNKNTQKEAQKLYKKSHTSSAPTEFVQELKSSPIITQAFNKVKSDPVYKEELQNTDESNFKYLDRVKQTLDDMHQSELRKGNKNKARLINSQIKNMTKNMDLIDPVYGEARNLAQRNILRSQIQDKIPNEEIRGSDFYNKFLANDNKYNKLYNSLKNVPEAQQQIQDMRLAFKDLVNPTSVRTAKGMSEKSTSANRNLRDVLVDVLHRMEGGHYDKASVDIMTSPDWIDRIGNPIYNQGISSKISRALSNYSGLSKI